MDELTESDESDFIFHGNTMDLMSLISINGISLSPTGPVGFYQPEASFELTEIPLDDRLSSIIEEVMGAIGLNSFIENHVISFVLDDSGAITGYQIHRNLPGSE